MDVTAWQGAKVRYFLASWTQVREREGEEEGEKGGGREGEGALRFSNIETKHETRMVSK